MHFWGRLSAMDIAPLIEFFGWCSAVLVGSALMNYILKTVNRRYISPRKGLKPDLIKWYRVFMQLHYLSAKQIRFFPIFLSLFEKTGMYATSSQL
jgi:hypothetical protein